MLGVLLGALTLFQTPVAGSTQAASSAEPPLPNIVLILTDDQAKGTLAGIPYVASHIRDQGVDFTNAIIPTSICCPSRAALLTGNHSHTTGVYTNYASNLGGWSAFHPHEGSTLATQLDSIGYQTALIGKYINGFPNAMDSGEASIPPGWDLFSYVSTSTQGDLYYNYDLLGT